MEGRDRPVGSGRAHRLFPLLQGAGRALSECGRLANVNNSPEHGPVLRGMVGFRRVLGFAETTQHYCSPGCSSMLHRRE